MATKTILLVEDDPGLAETAAAMLRLRQYRVIWAQTAQQAIAHLIEIDSDDLVLLDLVLGNDRGEDVVGECRAQGVTLPPLIIASAQSAPECKAAMQKTDAICCLPKPYSGSELLRAVTRAIG
jgi:DNA-binding response OmpR family regulator